MKDQERLPSHEDGFNRKAFLDSFIQYRLTPEAETDFRGYAKFGKDVDRDIIEKRISVLIHTATSKTELPNNRCRYQFAGFVILTNEDEHSVHVVYWVDRKLEVTPSMSQDLINKYHTIGLDDGGFALLSSEE